MMSTWWVVWTLFMFVFFVPALSYGWGYRSWGPPLPTHVQRWRDRRAIKTGAPGSLNHLAWGRTGDLVWGAVVIGLVWACIGVWW